MAIASTSDLTAGFEAQARRFWDEEFFQTFRRIAYRYGAEPDAGYPFYEIRRDHVVSWLKPIAAGKLLDVGCGGGHVMEALRAQGWDPAGCDFSPRMVGFAQQRLAAVGWHDASIEQHPATDLSAYRNDEFDAVLCLGPIEYLNDDESLRAYSEMRRVLASGGILICAHINGLFDLFTMDGFTAEFLERVLGDAYKMTTGAQVELGHALRQRLGTAQSSGPSRSLRARVPTRSDNPLTINNALARCGFEMKDQRFYRFYSAPPSVQRALGKPETDAIRFEHELAQGWPGHILASSFLTFSVKR